MHIAHSQCSHYVEQPCAFNPHNKKYNLTERFSYMCGLTAHAVQLHELWFISRGQKTTCKKKSTYKTIDWKVSSVFGVSSVFIWVRSWRDPVRSHSSSVREVIPLSPSQPAPVISALYRCKWSHRPTETERGSISTILVQLETERRNLQRTPPGQL